jgi:FAS-associated factor 2
MADTAFDVDRLDDAQRAALQTYTAVTDQAHSAAIPLLQRSQWNVQVCELVRNSLQIVN